jgi:hypothetical protein
MRFVTRRYTIYFTKLLEQKILCFFPKENLTNTIYDDFMEKNGDQSKQKDNKLEFTV